MTLVFVNEDPTFMTPSVTTGKCTYYDVTSDAARRCRGLPRRSGWTWWVLPEPRHGRASSGGNTMPSNRQQILVCCCGVSSARKHTWNVRGNTEALDREGELEALTACHRCGSSVSFAAAVKQASRPTYHSDARRDRRVRGRVMPGSEQGRRWGCICFSHTQKRELSLMSYQTQNVTPDALLF